MKNVNLSYVFSGVIVFALIFVGSIWILNEDGSSNSSGLVSAADHVRGNKDSNITVIEYADFQCSYCKDFKPTIDKLVSSYGDKVKFVYRHFPLSFHQNAQISSEASECAGEQSKFWEFYDKAFINSSGDGSGLNKTDLQKYATELSLNMDQFNTCLNDSKYSKKVNSDADFGQSDGVTGTPSVVIIDSNGKKETVVGNVPYEQIQSKLDTLLK